ncbi:MAG: hypothetical protein HC809_07295 [Gammaproteobacteria bacterium]|nr:hypothetical protein [Gammaproteobacteria bacterium]
MAGSIEELAETRDGVALTSALAVDRKALIESFEVVMDRATRQPRLVLEVAGRLLKDFASITLGNSDIAPTPKDARFKDASWQENGLYRRLGQSYLAWSHAVDDWLAKSGLDGINRERARFILDIMKDLGAPMNTLLGNPEAMQKLVETGGRSVWQGITNYIEDIRHNHGYPAVADRHAFELGKDVAATPGTVVYRNELLEVIQYRPTTATVQSVPLLYVFSQVNRFYLGDLTPDRSLFRQLLDAGIQVFAVSWRNPTEEHKQWGSTAYAEGDDSRRRSGA